MLLTQPSDEALQGLDSLARQPRWRDVTAAIDAEITQCSQRLLKAQDLRQIGELQGRILALQGLQAWVATAADVMQKKGLRPSF